MFAYCGNNPLIKTDSSGSFWDYAVDWGWILWDIYELTEEEKNLGNWCALLVDVVFAVVPFVPSGAGQIIKATDSAKDVFGIWKKSTVIGETMDRVRDFAKAVGASDNLYDGFSLYGKWAQKGYFGKICAEIGGKLSNATWLLGKLRSGYTIFDIGIDSARAQRSSSYFLEQIITALWESRNIWKSAIHIGEWLSDLGEWICD